MGVGYGAVGGTSISISGSITTTPNISQPASSQTLKSINNICNGSSQTVYTPAAGKTFYLFGANLTVNSAGASVSVFGNDGTTACMSLATTSSGTAMGGIYAHGNGGGCPIEQYDNTHPLKITGTNTCGIRVWGVEI